jgi:hypothetical protein
MRYLPFVVKSALRNVRRFVCTVLTEPQRENPGEIAH